ncbi:uncharacterized protein LOC117429428 isoform X2 [Acipenser ruthenus]|nr:uncharacterized protein LOC117429428 isoform X2 [Acipenser ruthenus]
MTCHQTSSPLWYVDCDLDFQFDSDVKFKKNHDKMKCDVKCQNHDKMKCDVKCQNHDKMKCDVNSNTITLHKAENSAMYACEPSSKHKSSCLKAKSLNSAFTKCNCQSLEFFIVAVTDDDDDDDDETSEGKTIILIEDAAAQPLTKEPGDNVTLPCKFNLTKRAPYTVYWIKSENGNTCLHSNHATSNLFENNTHCCVEGTGLERMIYKEPPNPYYSPCVHDLIITSVRASDRGRYVCIVNVFDSDKITSRVITNISIDISTSKSSVSTSKPQTTPQAQDPLLPLYIIGAVVLAVLIGAIALVMRKKKANTKGSTSLSMQRDQQVVELQDTDCTPYAVVGRNNVEGADTSEPYSVVRLAPESCSQEKGDGMNPERAEPYSVVRLNTEYEGTALSLCEAPKPCNQQGNRDAPADHEAHIYDKIDDNQKISK